MRELVRDVIDLGPPIPEVVKDGDDRTSVVGGKPKQFLDRVESCVGCELARPHSVRDERNAVVDVTPTDNGRRGIRGGRRLLPVLAVALGTGSARKALHVLSRLHITVKPAGARPILTIIPWLQNLVIFASML